MIIDKIQNRLMSILSICYISYVAYFIISYFAAPQRVVVGIIALSGIYITVVKVRSFTSMMPLWLQSGIMTLLILVWGFIGLYFYLQYPALIYERDGANTALDLFIACLLIIFILFYTYISYGLTIPLVVVIFLFYATFGQLFPGFLYHPGIRPIRLLQETSLSFSGMFGLLPQVGLKYVIIFIMLAGFANAFGGMNFIINLARRMARKNERMIPQISVVSSMFFGSVSGSAAANVAGTGSFTIPLMKKFGIPPKMAGGIEAAASAGGQIMPPIMGTTAFVIAEFLGIQYVDVLMAGIFPALLFYISLMAAVYVITLSYMKRHGNLANQIGRLNGEEVQLDIMEPICLAASLATIFYFLLVPKLSAMHCGLYGVIVYLVAQSVFWTASRLRRKQGQNLLKTLMDGAILATTNSAPIIILLSCLGIIVKILVGSGLATRLAYGLVEIAGNQLLVVILLVMVLCILFGMAVTTVAAYILTVIIAAPALNAFGIPDLATHFAIFYFAMLSAITPPVAGIIPIACGISQSKFMETAWEAMKLGVAKYVLPFCFIFEPDLLKFNGTGLKVFLSFAVGILDITIALQMKSKRVLTIGIRVMLMILGFIILFFSKTILSYTCLALSLAFGGLIFAYGKRRKKLVC